MDEAGSVQYQQCATCGRWHPVDAAFARRFCSRECASSYRCCPVCGEYFKIDSLTSDGYCSADCARWQDKNGE